MRVGERRSSTMRSARWAALLLITFAATAGAKPPPYVTISNIRPAELI